MKYRRYIYLTVLATINCVTAKASVPDADFDTRKSSLPQEYFSVFADSASMDAETLRCMKFLYAYMPLPDLTDYPSDYYKENVEVALRARREMPWGSIVPEREFMHFVLPIRVNNENLDGHRPIFYEELKERVKGMTMSEAILEVNHWCHEHVTYQPSDSRTHSPLASISSAIGRCGEESTYTVAALRSIGIPARQVYTPRWAHTDDNHAWVEAWADGRWHFLGACEPEAVLDLGWFNDPASRGMLMNTRTFGRYDGPEEKLLEADMYTDINVTSNYAAVDTLMVHVVDAHGDPIAGASVDFCLYNYAEFYPVARKKTDAAGNAQLVAGLGDMVVWAAKDGNFNFKKVSVGKDGSVDIVIDPDNRPKGTYSLDIVPPAGKTGAVEVDPVLAATNKCRLAYEDSLRNAYTSTFVDKSRGNRATIDRFLGDYGGDERTRAQSLLDNLTKKDWTDVTYQVLTDAFREGDACRSSEYDFYAKYILSPRIESEFLVPFRRDFASVFTEAQKSAFRADPALWAKWVIDNISDDQVWQPSRVRMSPMSVYRLRHTDTASRGVFFVAGARAMGIPARIDPVTGKPQYFAHDRWCDMLEAGGENAPADNAKLQLSYLKSGRLDDPGYYYHFTISKIEDGCPSLLNYDEEATWRNDFSAPVDIEAGDYMLVSGQRMADGGVLCHVDIFNVDAGANVSVPLTIRQDGTGLKVIGNFDSESLYGDISTDTKKSILSTTGRGFYVLGVVSNNHEPSNHTLRDIANKKAELESLGIPMVILYPDKAEAQQAELTAGLPSQAVIGWDIDGKIRGQLTENLHLGRDLPIFVIADTFNRVVFVTQGYTIGLGQQLLDATSTL